MSPSLNPALVDWKFAAQCGCECWPPADFTPHQNTSSVGDAGVVCWQSARHSATPMSPGHKELRAWPLAALDAFRVVCRMPAGAAISAQGQHLQGVQRAVGTTAALE